MFLRDIGKLSPDEHILYNYWMIMLMLLEMGLPWTVIDELTTDEISLILAVQAAKRDREQEQEAKQQQFSQMRR
jgi:hypothetical protein